MKKRRRPPKRIPWLPILIVAFVFLVIGSVAGYVFRSAIMAQVSSWRASVQRAQTARLIEAEEWERAYPLALEAYRLDPSSKQGLRFLFETASETGNAGVAVQTATVLSFRADLEFEEKVELLEYFERNGGDNRFSELYDGLTEPERRNPDVIYLRARYLASQNRENAARRLVENHLKAAGGDERFERLLARLLMRSNLSKEREEGQELVAAMMTGADEESQKAFGLLWDVPPAAIQPELFPADLEGWVERLPNPGVKEELIVAQVALARTRGYEARQDEIVSGVAQRLGRDDPDLVCQWLSRFSRFDLILELVDEELGRQSLSLYNHRLRAITAVDGLEAAQQWLSDPHPDTPELTLWLNRARAAHHRNDEERERECWKEAFSIAELQNPNGYLGIFRSALELERLDIASRALITAAPITGCAYPTSREVLPLIPYLYNRDRLEDLNLISRRLLQREPEKISLRNNVVYLSLILGEPLEDSVEIARELVKQEPRKLGLRSTLALALLHEDRAARALSVLEEEKLSLDRASPPDLMIRAHVLRRNGQDARARELLSQVDRSALTPTERRALALTSWGEETDERNPDQLHAEVRFWMNQGGIKHARQLVEEYFESGGEERRFRSLYVSLLLQSPDEESGPTEAQKIVADLLKKPDRHAREALTLLSALPTKQLQPALFPTNLTGWVSSLPEPTPTEKIMAAKLDYLGSTDPEEGESIVQAIVSSLGSTNPEAVAGMLADLDHHELVLTLLDEETARTSPRLRDYRMEALITQQGADSAEEWLDSSKSPTATPSAWLSTAKLRHEMGDRIGMLNAFREASSLAQRDPNENHFLAIYETALELDQTPVAIRALLNASLHPAGELPSSGELASVLTQLDREGRIEDLHTLTRTLLRQEPENAALQNRVAYLSLIVKDPTGRSVEVARQLVEEHPNILGFKTTLALALTLDDENEEALRVLPEDQAAWRFASASDLAIYALVLENSGHFSQAAKVRSRYDVTQLSDAERRTFAEARKPRKTEETEETARSSVPRASNSPSSSPNPLPAPDGPRKPEAELSRRTTVLLPPG